jgi:peptide/nickel transport system substrate-binding protein
VIQANLKRIGIMLRVESVDYAAWVQRWQRKEFALTLNTTAGFADPDAAFYRAFHSKAQNWNSLDNPELDRLLDAGRATWDIEQRKPIYDQLTKALETVVPWVWLFSGNDYYYMSDKVHGFSPMPDASLQSLSKTSLSG